MGTIIACVIGILIGLGVIAGITVLSKQNKVGTFQKVLFYCLGSAITIASILSIIFR
jgi:cytochrome c oxidase assembly factor CtaG